MIRFVLRRVTLAIPLVLGLTLITFVLASFMPGDVVDYLMNPASGLSGEALQAQREALGLNKPVLLRYAIWLNQLMHGNLGYSFVNRQPVAQRIGERLLPTLELMGAALAGGLLLAIPLGILLAVRQYSYLDHTLTFVAFASISIPTFFLGLGAIYLFAVRLGWFPAAGMYTIGAGFNLLDRIHHLILPAAVLGSYELARYMRYMRSSMLEVIHEQYMVTARSKGLAEIALLLKHGLRNAVLPVITDLGFSLPVLFSGAIITEQVFQWPGMGMLTIEALNARDYPTLMSLNLFAASLVLLGSLLADIGYALVDPRIRFD